MDLFRDDLRGVPAPSDFEFELEEARRARAEAEYNQSQLDQAKHRIERLETALAATIRAIAFSQNMETAWFDEPAERHLARAAQVLGLDLSGLGLKYTIPSEDTLVEFANLCAEYPNEPRADLWHRVTHDEP